MIPSRGLRRARLRLVVVRLFVIIRHVVAQLLRRRGNRVIVITHFHEVRFRPDASRINRLRERDHLCNERRCLLC